MELGRSGGVGNDRKSFRTRKRGLIKWASGIRIVGRVAGVALVGWLGGSVLGGSVLVRWVVGWIIVGWVAMSVGGVGWIRGAGWVLMLVVIRWNIAGWVVVVVVLVVSVGVGWIIAEWLIIVVSVGRWVRVVRMFSGVRLMFSGARLMIGGDGMFEIERWDFLELERRDFLRCVSLDDCSGCINS